MLVKPIISDNDNITPNTKQENELNDSKKDLLVINKDLNPNSKKEEEEQKKEENKIEDVK